MKKYNTILRNNDHVLFGMDINGLNLSASIIQVYIEVVNTLI